MKNSGMDDVDEDTEAQVEQSIVPRPVVDSAEKLFRNSLASLGELHSAIVFHDENINSNKLKREHDKIMQMMSRRKKPGHNWYLVDSGWFRRWKMYSSNTYRKTNDILQKAVPPGPLDNSPLCTDRKCTAVRRELKEGPYEDYVAVPADAWRQLVARYGRYAKQAELVYPVIENPHKRGIFEVCPNAHVCLAFYDAENPHKMYRGLFQHTDTIREVRNMILEEILENSIAVYNLYGYDVGELTRADGTRFEDDKQSVKRSGLKSGDVVVFAPWKKS